MRYSNVGKYALVLSFSAVLSSCVSFQKETEIETQAELTDEITKSWADQEPAITHMSGKTATVVSSPSFIPEKYRKIPVDFKFSRNLELSELSVFLEQLGVYFVASGVDIGKKKVMMPSYKGRLGNFLDAMSSVHNVAFHWDSGVIVAREHGHYVMSIPQDEELISNIRTEMQALGALEVAASLTAGVISYKATPKTQIRIKRYLTKLTENAAMVTMQVALISVNLDRNRNTGFDWGSLSAKFGDLGVHNFNNNGFGGGSTTGQTSTGGGTDTGSGSNSSNNSTETNAAGQLLTLVGDALKLDVARGQFDLVGMVNALSTYGKTKTLQSVQLKTLSGRETKLRSGSSVPFVSSIGVSTLGTNQGYSNGFGNNSNRNFNNNGNNGNFNNGNNGNFNNGNNNNGGFNNGGSNNNQNNGNFGNNGGSLFGSANTSNIDTGLTLTLKPFYDADSEIVTVDLDMEVKSILSFVELSAGNQIGSITQPNTQEQEFTDVIKLKAGQSAILGGLMIETDRTNQATLAYLEDYDMASAKSSVNRQALFIMLRPAVTVYGNFKKSKEVVRR